PHGHRGTCQTRIPDETPARYAGFSVVAVHFLPPFLSGPQPTYRCMEIASTRGKSTTQGGVTSIYQRLPRAHRGDRGDWIDLKKESKTSREGRIGRMASHHLPARACAARLDAAAGLARPPEWDVPPRRAASA